MTGQAPAEVLTVRRKLQCPAEDVFDAWTDPDALRVWFGGPMAKLVSVAADARVGGVYRLTFQRGDQVGSVEGTYLEVKPPERLVFTWRWDRAEIEERRESLVTVELIDRDGDTEVVVTHEGIKTESSFAFHMDGWTTVMPRLEQYLAGSLS